MFYRKPSPSILDSSDWGNSRSFRSGCSDYLGDAVLPSYKRPGTSCLSSMKSLDYGFSDISPWRKSRLDDVTGRMSPLRATRPAPFSILDDDVGVRKRFGSPARFDSQSPLSLPGSPSLNRKQNENFFFGRQNVDYSNDFKIQMARKPIFSKTIARRIDYSDYIRPYLQSRPMLKTGYVPRSRAEREEASVPIIRQRRLIKFREFGSESRRNSKICWDLPNDIGCLANDINDSTSDTCDLGNDKMSSKSVDVADDIGVCNGLDSSESSSVKSGKSCIACGFVQCNCTATKEASQRVENTSSGEDMVHETREGRDSNEVIYVSSIKAEPEDFDKKRSGHAVRRRRRQAMFSTEDSESHSENHSSRSRIRGRSRSRGGILEEDRISDERSPSSASRKHSVDKQKMESKKPRAELSCSEVPTSIRKTSYQRVASVDKTSNAFDEHYSVHDKNSEVSQVIVGKSIPVKAQSRPKEVTVTQTINIRSTATEKKKPDKILTNWKEQTQKRRTSTELCNTDYLKVTLNKKDNSQELEELSNASQRGETCENKSEIDEIVVICKIPKWTKPKAVEQQKENLDKKSTEYPSGTAEMNDVSLSKKNVTVHTDILKDELHLASKPIVTEANRPPEREISSSAPETEAPSKLFKDRTMANRKLSIHEASNDKQKLNDTTNIQDKQSSLIQKKQEEKNIRKKTEKSRVEQHPKFLQDVYPDKQSLKKPDEKSTNDKGDLQNKDSSRKSPVSDKGEIGGTAPKTKSKVPGNTDGKLSVRAELDNEMNFRKKFGSEQKVSADSSKCSKNAEKCLVSTEKQAAKVTNKGFSSDAVAGSEPCDERKHISTKDAKSVRSVHDVKHASDVPIEKAMPIDTVRKISDHDVKDSKVSFNKKLQELKHTTDAKKVVKDTLRIEDRHDLEEAKTATKKAPIVKQLEESSSDVLPVKDKIQKDLIGDSSPKSERNTDSKFHVAERNVCNNRKTNLKDETAKMSATLKPIAVSEGKITPAETKDARTTEPKQLRSEQRIPTQTKSVLSDRKLPPPSNKVISETETCDRSIKVGMKEVKSSSSEKEYSPTVALKVDPSSGMKIQNKSSISNDQKTLDRIIEQNLSDTSEKTAVKNLNVKFSSPNDEREKRFKSTLDDEKKGAMKVEASDVLLKPQKEPAVPSQKSSSDQKSQTKTKQPAKKSTPERLPDAQLSTENTSKETKLPPPAKSSTASDIPKKVKFEKESKLRSAKKASQVTSAKSNQVSSEAVGKPDVKIRTDALKEHKVVIKEDSPGIVPKNTSTMKAETQILKVKTSDDQKISAERDQKNLKNEEKQKKPKESFDKIVMHSEISKTETIAEVKIQKNIIDHYAKTKPEDSQNVLKMKTIPDKMAEKPPKDMLSSHHIKDRTSKPEPVSKTNLELPKIPTPEQIAGKKVLQESSELVAPSNKKSCLKNKSPNDNSGISKNEVKVSNDSAVSPTHFNVLVEVSNSEPNKVTGNKSSDAKAVEKILAGSDDINRKQEIEVETPVPKLEKVSDKRAVESCQHKEKQNELSTSKNSKIDVFPADGVTKLGESPVAEKVEVKTFPLDSAESVNDVTITCHENSVEKPSDKPDVSVNELKSEQKKSGANVESNVKVPESVPKSTERVKPAPIPEPTTRPPRKMIGLFVQPKVNPKPHPVNGPETVGNVNGFGKVDDRVSDQERNRHGSTTSTCTTYSTLSCDDSNMLDDFKKISISTHEKKFRFRKYGMEDFSLLKLLGKGSFGKVLLAELKNTGMYFAIKCLKKDVVLEDDDVESTMIERRVLALGTQHPYMCTLYCTFQTQTHLCFVMEFLNGGDLMFHIQESGRFEQNRAMFYGAEVVSALKFLHKRSIVYRDIKLDNVVLDEEGHIRLVDFGMCQCRIYREECMPFNFCGTPQYIAPEIVTGQKYNQSVDWWSFGVLLYEMLTGRSPFNGTDEDELFWSICNEEPSYPRFLSKEARLILTSLLNKTPEKRLGMPSCPDGEITQHAFFRPIDWNKLEKKELKPPFKPTVKFPGDTSNFDSSFTTDTATLTPVDSDILRSMDQAQFKGFSYTNPHLTG